jgi:hypothetical protein
MDVLQAGYADPASDGHYSYSYYGKIDENYGSYIFFSLAYGNNNGIVFFKQNREMGNRSKRASLKFSQCKIQADQEICSSHKPSDFPGCHAITIPGADEMHSHEKERCGDFDTFYQREGSAETAPSPDH